LPTFTPAVRHAVREALREAAGHGVQHAGREYLLLGLLALVDSAAYRLVVEWSGLGGPATLTNAVRADRAYHAGGERNNWAAPVLTAARVLPVDRPRWWHWPWRASVWWLGLRWVRRPYRRHGARYGHPILLLIEGNATPKAVHVGHSTVTAAAVLLAVIDMHEGLAFADKHLPEDVALWCQAGEILAAYGVEGYEATRAAARLSSTVRDAEDDLSGVPTVGWWPPKVRIGAAPAQGRTALAALREASLSARRSGHPFAGTSHLLVALLVEPDGPATRLLRELGVNVDGVRARVERQLSVSRSG
jgi:hypothetical protein